MDFQRTYQETYDQILEYRRTVSKLQQENTKSEEEKEKMYNLYLGLKEVFEKVRLDNEMLKKKLETSLEEKKEMENKYKEQIRLLQESNKNQKENYEKQFKSLNLLNENTLRNKFLAEAEMKYTAEKREKENEIDQLNDEVAALRKEKQKLSDEFDLYKLQSKNEIDTLTKKYYSDIKEMMGKVNSSGRAEPISKKDDVTPLLVSELKIQITNLQNLTNAQNNTINSLKSQYNNLVIISENDKNNLQKEIDSLKFQNNLLKEEVNEFVNQKNSLSDNFFTLQNKVKILKNSYESSQIENQFLAKEKSELLAEKEVNSKDFESLKKLLEKEMLNHKNEVSQLRDGYGKILLEERKKVEQYQKEVEEKMKFINDKTEVYNEIVAENNKLKDENKSLRDSIKKIQKEYEEDQTISNLMEEKREIEEELFRREAEYRANEMRWKLKEERADLLQKQLLEKENELQRTKRDLENLPTHDYTEIYKKYKKYKEKSKECNEAIKKILDKLPKKATNEREEIRKVMEANVLSESPNERLEKSSSQLSQKPENPDLKAKSPAEESYEQEEYNDFEKDVGDITAKSINNPNESQSGNYANPTGAENEKNFNNYSTKQNTSANRQLLNDSKKSFKEDEIDEEIEENIEEDLNNNNGSATNN